MRGKFIFRLSLSMLMIFPSSVIAEENRIYQTDALGNIQYNKSSYSVQSDGRVYETDPIGNKLYSHQQYQIKGNEIYKTDSLGNIQYHQSYGKIK